MKYRLERFPDPNVAPAILAMVNLRAKLVLKSNYNIISNLISISYLFQMYHLLHNTFSVMKFSSDYNCVNYTTDNDN